MEKKFAWNKLKSKRLKLVRGVSFEEIIQSQFIEIIAHPSRPNQQVFVYKHKGYMWAVPFVETENEFFLKTIYPSRKLLKRYQGGKDEKIKID